MSIATIRQSLLSSLKDREYRAAFNLENVYTTICFQLRALREQRDMSQAVLGKQVKPMMAQERISILEDPNADSKPTLSTLLRLAEGLDIGLDVRFVPFSTVLERSTRTNMRELEVPSFETELPQLEQAVSFEVAMDGLPSAPKKPTRSYQEGDDESRPRVFTLAEGTRNQQLISRAECVAQQSAVPLWTEFQEPPHETVHSLAATGK